MNRWAASGEKQEERYGQFWELSQQSEQRHFEPSVVFFFFFRRDTEHSQTGENCNSQGIYGQKMTDGNIRQISIFMLEIYDLS